MKKILIISYYWPPNTGSGVQRWLKFSKYLVDFNWSPIIVTPKNPYIELKDSELINDVSGLNFDKNSIKILKKYNIPFVLQHSLGNPDVMQKNPKYKNVLLDIYDFFEEKLNNLRQNGIHHNNIILDPGIGFGKNLKHNLMLLNKVSIFHSLGFPILIGTSRKRFINHISKNFDTFERIGGTLSSILFLFLQLFLYDWYQHDQHSSSCLFYQLKKLDIYRIHQLYESKMSL